MLHRPPGAPATPPGAGGPERPAGAAGARDTALRPLPGRDPQPEGLSWQEATLSSRPGRRGTRGCRPPGTRAPRSRAAQDEIRGPRLGWGAREGSLCVSGGFVRALSAAAAMGPKTRAWGICH
ncbi:uncharacterized protein LOC113907888 isoform X1 [Zalophus californianus]|uniref:Uncharacterized protein LOC113907888 isoform X1 n=1 Tax=Zalophus californianus TaxID=9704 RepID=A0A6P9F3V7_ZALCA|nr:uncharacterized protein LOC113907888 isoform X1 [Zalophus californianus]